MQPVQKFDVVVIGGGPAGLLAGGRAGQLGMKVAILEKMEKPARKLRITGKGRCNITNLKSYDDFVGEIVPNSHFLAKAFGNFFSSDIINLLESNGVPTVTERGQRVFPASGKAWDVAEALVGWAKRCGAQLFNHYEVESLLVSGRAITGLKVRVNKLSESIVFSCKAIVVATGGKSYPATGSTGDGYRFAQQVGHTLTDLRPALTGIETHPAFSFTGRLTLKNVQTTLWVDGAVAGEEFGEVELADYGLSGPAILKLSLKSVDAFRSNRKVRITIDLKPALTEEKLEARIIRDTSRSGYFSLEMLLRGLLPPPLVPVYLRLMNLKPKLQAALLNEAERKKLVGHLKNLSFEMTGYRGWNEAIVTAGGVSLNEVDDSTMASKLVQGLFLAGEVLDLTGNTGGYNLQIAFSTGWLAGQSAAAFVQKNA